jgi:hypothetical protein
MREILLSKFGRHLFPKVHCVRFPVDEKFYRLLDETLNHLERVDAFRRELNVPDGRLLVTVGHNVNPANNHLAIIEALARLPASDKSAAIWVFPMTYLKDESHRLRWKKLPPPLVLSPAFSRTTSIGNNWRPFALPRTFLFTCRSVML